MCPAQANVAGDRCDKFALKTATDPRLANWYLIQPQVWPLRLRNMYQEFPAKTTRLINSPIFNLRHTYLD